ncbi:BPSL0067 family protein [Sediminicoccus sp. KRV36]|uniref:BPSL0067 family protein n=1 Tax=Sediminicoccus sp. KRV36 TaxID=3133721 RepID=UPI00200F10B2|nr:BPSL0067 family protein [Sediminicoccus rosea]UPY35223.1 BPSL0067 family protein [Sediminicoccus rosea]
MGAGSRSALENILAYATGETRPEDFEFYLTQNPEFWEQQVSFLGNGHCVPLVQAACGAPVTMLWRKGPWVRANPAIPRGTAIATFTPAGRYANLDTGNHAAVYLGETSEGLMVVDQWQTRTPARPGRRLLTFRGGDGSPSNDGDAFFVILTPRRITSEELRQAWLSLLS